MGYTHSNAGNVNFLGKNQLFKQFRLILFCVLCLLGLTTMSSVRAANECDSFLSCCDTGKNCRQFYLGGIVGADFATLDKIPPDTTIPNQSIFTAGGTVGMRLKRNKGALRFEFEGRGRDQLEDTKNLILLDVTWRATDSWSTMVNVWRDYKPFESLGIYAGGGIGAGGYRWNLTQTEPAIDVGGSDRVSNFAWQAGGGLFYEISKRATVDLGYRFFSISESTIEYNAFGTQTSPTNFAASELLLTVRIYEPFRRWR
jgi:opacity protein-like surface antigen